MTAGDKSAEAGASIATVVTPARNPDEALFREEVARMRAFSTFALVLCGFVLVGFPLFGGDPLLRSVTMAGAGVSVLSSLWFILVYRDPARYRQVTTDVSAMVSVFFGHAGIVYWGIFSPAPMLMLFGLYFFARGQRLGSALCVYIPAAALQGVTAALFLGGVVPDPGLITAADVPMTVRVATQVMVQLTYAGVFAFARSSRRGTLQAMSDLVAAQRQAAQREAAFQEMRQDLARVLEPGRAGHYTDRTLGRWRLGGIVGRGAMGEVYEAESEGGERAAVKVLHPTVLANPSSVGRFLREARAASAIDSPHAVRVLEADDGPVPYLAMELLSGQDLAQMLRDRRRLGLTDLGRLLEQVGALVDAARARGIVHRDLKPQNLFCVGEGAARLWKVLDFGASKLADSAGTLTQGRVVGTPSYMSPEQARGEDVDGRADLYSLAAIAYRCVTGRAPYTGKDLPTTLYRVVYGTPPQPSALAEVPPGVEDVLAIGLAKRAEDRFASGSDFAAAFSAAALGHRDPELARRAEILLVRHPWGMTPTYRD